MNAANTCLSHNVVQCHTISYLPVLNPITWGICSMTGHSHVAPSFDLVAALSSITGIFHQPRECRLACQRPLTRHANAGRWRQEAHAARLIRASHKHIDRLRGACPRTLAVHITTGRQTLRATRPEAEVACRAHGLATP